MAATSPSSAYPLAAPVTPALARDSLPQHECVKLLIHEHNCFSGPISLFPLLFFFPKHSPQTTCTKIMGHRGAPGTCRFPGLLKQRLPPSPPAGLCTPTPSAGRAPHPSPASFQKALLSLPVHLTGPPSPRQSHRPAGPGALAKDGAFPSGALWHRPGGHAAGAEQTQAERDQTRPEPPGR